MHVRSLPRPIGESSHRFSFDPANATAIQGAQRYTHLRATLLFASGIAALICFSHFIQWLPNHVWTESHTRQVILAIASIVVFGLLVLFGIAGIVSMYSRTTKGDRMVFWIFRPDFYCRPFF